MTHIINPQNTTPEAQLNIASQLWDAQAKLNNGNGVSCVRSICDYLRSGQLDDALATRQWDGDKTRQYPALEALITELLGCRLHHTIKCMACMK